jgi:tricorn protease
MKRILFVVLLFSLITLGFAGKEARMMRFPDINGKLVAFVYAGDIWTVASEGGSARRLTSHKGLELFPKISPDGKWIAFSAEYSGSRQVYVMPAHGGRPTQLTFYNDVGIMPPRGGWDYVVMDWTPDSRKVMVKANRTPFGRRVGKYYLVDIDGGLETPLQIPEAGFGSFSPDGKQVCYTPISREFRTWKRYKGGRAADVWVYDLEKDTSKQLTTFVGSDQIPSWYKDKIYFASDRELTLNIFSYDLNNGDIKQMTHHTEYDVMWPSGEGNGLVYENGGYLYKLDLDSGKESKIPVHINYDSPYTLPYFKKVKDDIYSMAISPTGKRALFDARGDIFSVPAKHGEIENLTNSQGIRELFPAWSPDGKYIAYYSDKTGEYEVYLRETSGKGEPVQLTKGSSSWKYPAIWSPDGKKLVFSDRKSKLQVLDIDTKAVTAVDRGSRFDIRDYVWAPDSGWVAYTKDGENGQGAIWVYSLKDGKARQLTNNRYNDQGPVFSTDGKYLFFLSDRTYNMAFSSHEFDYVYNKSTKVYAVALQKSTPPLFKDKDDKEEVKKPETAAKGKSKAKKKKDKAAPKKKVTVRIDFDGIDDRVAALTAPADNYNFIEAIDGKVLYIRARNLYLYDIDKKKEQEILPKVRDLALSADKKKLLYLSGGKYGIIDIKPKQKPGTGELKLDDLQMRIEPLKEWPQIFNDGWRIFRDWFYAANLHGVDWQKMKKRYGQLVPYVKHRADLDYIFGELVGESNTGHCYVNWGDFPRVKRMDTGLLGAELTADKNAGRYKIAKIYKGENWSNRTRSPLTGLGVDVKEGDYLIELNGQNVTLKDNPYRFLENTVGKRVSIVVNNKPDKTGSRKSMIKPIRSEQTLFYLDWVESRRKMVDKLSGGRIGYIHVPDTAFQGNRELFKGMYAFHNKEALIIDERYNGGGFIPGVMTDFLNRITYGYWARRHIKPFRTPGIMHEGPKVMLMNYYSSSGGDAFPYFFKKRKLGKLIGTRTWGGLVGISGNAGFVDGGGMNVPTFGIYDTDGQWAVEGIGVYPDIKVVDAPHLVAKGKDPCIEKAVEVLLKQLKENPVKKVKPPADPDRSKWIEKEIK